MSKISPSDKQGMKLFLPILNIEKYILEVFISLKRGADTKLDNETIKAIKE